MEKKIIGYTTGVYDMFHIGHLNIIRRAKEQCDYLIVGVSTDELVKAEKNKTPVIPYEERAEIVAALKYVDQVVPQVDKDEFERQFEPYGVEIVYLPHTDGVSSTKLTGVIKDILDEHPEYEGQ